MYRCRYRYRYVCVCVCDWRNQNYTGSLQLIFVEPLNLFRKSVNIKTIRCKIVGEENILVVTKCPLDICKSIYKKENVPLQWRKPAITAFNRVNTSSGSHQSDIYVSLDVMQ